jgi:hypothetical protein
MVGLWPPKVRKMADPWLDYAVAGWLPATDLKKCKMIRGGSMAWSSFSCPRQKITTV